MTYSDLCFEKIALATVWRIDWRWGKNGSKGTVLG